MNKKNLFKAGTLSLKTKSRESIIIRRNNYISLSF